MITLGEAIKLIQVRESTLVRLRQKGIRTCGLPFDCKYFAINEMRKQFDFKKVMVYSIKPTFTFNEYDCLEFVVTGPGFERKE